MRKEKFQFKKKAYNEEATSEEVQAIKENVFIYDPQIIYLKQLPIVSPFSINLMFDRVELLGKKMEAHGLLIDIRNTERPNALARREINQRFSLLCKNLTHVAFCTGKNFLINTTVRFVMYQTNLESFSIKKTIESSIDAIKNEIQHVK